MEELARHIEVLLLENDCVIVPGLGGFIAHDQPSAKADDEDVFTPPSRSIGFNPLLRLNDGLLIQSYMSVYSTSYFEASKIIEHQVRELMDTLYEDGKVQLRNIGELQYDIAGRYRFTPCTDKIPTPALYGLDSFSMPDLQELAAREAESERMVAEQQQHRHEPAKVVVMQPQPAKATTETERQGAMVVKMRRIGQYAAGIAAAILVILASFFFATPLEDTPTVTGNYADMLPRELFDKFNCNSLLFSPVVDVKAKTTTKADKATSKAQPAPEQEKVETKTQPATESTAVANTATTEAPATITTENKPEVAKPQTAKKLYNVIVASVGSEEGADGMVQKLKAQGYTDAKVIVGDGKIRVSLQSFEVEADAYRSIHNFQQQGLFDQAWVLRR